MRPLLLIGVLVGSVTVLAESRVFHVEPLATLARCRHTHIEIQGTVTRVRHEADGDVHLRVEDGHGHFVMCEVVPYHPVPIPRVGDHVRVRGIRRVDTAPHHGFVEVHPVEELLVLR